MSKNETKIKNEISIRIWGDMASFNPPWSKVERYSYPIPTVSACKGILDSIHWKPAIRWVIDEIHVLKKIQREKFYLNELNFVPTSAKKPVIIEKHRMIRANDLLVNVEYIIKAHVELTGVLHDKEKGIDTNWRKHIMTFKKRAEKGVSYKPVFLGMSNFDASFVWDTEEHESELKGELVVHRLLHSIYDDEGNENPIFFDAILNNGVLKVPNICRGLK